MEKVSRMEPMNWTGCELVEVIPGKVSGEPLIRGTRVPADLVLSSLESGEAVDEIAYNYDLQPAIVRELQAFLQRHLAA
jgi:uncharacterized protein (DUF433 family)